MSRLRAERDWLEQLADLMSTPLTSMPAEQIALQLCATFDSTACAYSDVLNGERRIDQLWPQHEQLRGHREELTRWALTRNEEHPLTRYYQVTRQRIPIQMADVPRDVAGPVALRAWNEIGSSIGCPDQLAIPLRLGPGSIRALVLGRSGRYLPSEVELATVLWRLLTGLDGQIAVLQSTFSAQRNDDRAAEAAGLTPRELAILALLSEGITAMAIARRLAISQRTVHKHLQRIYSKLQAPDRLTAVLRARDWGLLPHTPGAGATLGQSMQRNSVSIVRR